MSRRNALDDSKSSSPSTADHWRTLQAAEDAAATQLASSRKRLLRTVVRAPVDGIVIPAKPVARVPPSANAVRLMDFQSTEATTKNPWCRISESWALHAALVIDARDRLHIKTGTQVMISLSRSPEDVIPSTVVSVSEIRQDESTITQESAYQILCPLPDALIADDPDAFLPMIGQECRAVVRLPRRSFSSQFVTWVSDWIRG